MRSSIDAVGRIVIPKVLRDRLQLGSGQAVEISERDGRIVIEAVAMPMRLVQRRKRFVAAAKKKLPPLTDEIVRATIERTRR